MPPVDRVLGLVMGHFLQKCTLGGLVSFFFNIFMYTSLYLWCFFKQLYIFQYSCWIIPWTDNLTGRVLHYVMLHYISPRCESILWHHVHVSCFLCKILMWLLLSELGVPKIHFMSQLFQTLESSLNATEEITQLLSHAECSEYPFK